MHTAFFHYSIVWICYQKNKDNRRCKLEMLPALFPRCCHFGDVDDEDSDDVAITRKTFRLVSLPAYLQYIYLWSYFVVFFWKKNSIFNKQIVCRQHTTRTGHFWGKAIGLELWRMATSPIVDVKECIFYDNDPVSAKPSMAAGDCWLHKHSSASREQGVKASAHYQAFVRFPVADSSWPTDKITFAGT